jgi:hypothetical protein
MATFVRCSLPSMSVRRDHSHTNSPINLDLCSRFDATHETWYPQTRIETIAFKLVGESDFVSWWYNSAKERDADYERLLRFCKLDKGMSDF